MSESNELTSELLELVKDEQSLSADKDVQADVFLRKHELVPLNPTTQQPVTSTALTDNAKIRVMLFHKAQGQSDLEIAAYLGMRVDRVKIIVHQQWFKNQLTALLQRLRVNVVQRVLDAEVLESIATLVSLRDNPGVKHATRVQCAITLIEHARGKATQRVIEEKQDVTEADAHDIDAELTRLETEQKMLPNLVNIQSNVS